MVAGHTNNDAHEQGLSAADQASEHCFQQCDALPKGSAGRTEPASPSVSCAAATVPVVADAPASLCLSAQVGPNRTCPMSDYCGPFHQYVGMWYCEGCDREW